MPPRTRTAMYAFSCLFTLEAQDCWRSADVVVVNRANEPIAVTVEAWRGYPGSCDCPDGFIHPDLAMAADGYEDGTAGPWRSVDSAVLQRDTSAQLGPQLFVHVALPPRTALRLGRVLIEGDRIMGDPPFWTLEIAGAGRMERYEGSMVGRLFTRIGGGFVYVFTAAR